MLHLTYDDIMKNEVIKKDEAVLVYVYDISDQMTVGFITKKTLGETEMLKRAVNEVYFNCPNAYELVDIIKLTQEEKNNVLQHTMFDVKNDEGFLCKLAGRPLCYLYY